MFKEIFSVPEHAASHLRSVLPAELVARVDWKTLSLESSRLQISGLDAKEADVLLSAQLAGKLALRLSDFREERARRVQQREITLMMSAGGAIV